MRNGAAVGPLTLGRDQVKSVRFNRLLASTALGLALALASHAGMAQQSEQAATIDAGVPVPDTTLPPPPTVKDLTPPPDMQSPAAAAEAPKDDTAKAAPAAADSPAQAAAVPKDEPKAEPAPAPTEKAAAPAVEPAQPVAAASGVTDEAVAGKLRELIGSKQFDRI